MRLRLGLLQSTAAIDRQTAREAAEAQAKKHKNLAPTVKTEAETRTGEIAAAARQKGRVEKSQEATEKPLVAPRIRPLSEAKAIDTGATFISETFLFLVAGGLIVFESLRARRKEASRREDVADRLAELEESEKAARRALVALEHELLRLRAESGHRGSKDVKHIIPKEIWQKVEPEEVTRELTILDRVARMVGWRKDVPSEEGKQDAAPPVDTSKGGSTAPVSPSEKGLATKTAAPR
jgi:myosin-1